MSVCGASVYKRGNYKGRKGIGKDPARSHFVALLDPHDMHHVSHMTSTLACSLVIKEH